MTTAYPTYERTEAVSVVVGAWPSGMCTPHDFLDRVKRVERRD